MPQLERPGKEGTESRLRLQTAVRLRWFGVAGQLVTVCYVYFVLGLPVRCRHLPGADRAHRLAQRVPAHALPRAHTAQHCLCHRSPGLRHPPARRAPLSHRRHREPLRVPDRGAGDGLGRHAAAAQHHRARHPCGRRNGAARLLPPRAALVQAGQLRAADALQRRRAGVRARRHAVPRPLRLATVERGAPDGGRARRHRDGAGTGAAAARPRRARGRGRARARHAALHHRRGGQGAGARGPAGRHLHRRTWCCCRPRRSAAARS